VFPKAAFGREGSAGTPQIKPRRRALMSRPGARTDMLHTLAVFNTLAKP
jgi:hypothetical protein